MLIAIESIYGDKLLHGKRLKLSEIKSQLESLFSTVDEKDFVPIACARLGFEELPYDDREQKVDLVIDLSTHKVYKPQYYTNGGEEILSSKELMNRYFSIHPDCYTETWRTTHIEEYLKKINILQAEGNGGFRSIDCFCDIQLLLVNNWDSWNNNDYNSIETNYISIVTEDDFLSKYELLFKELSVFLGRSIIEEK